MATDAFSTEHVRSAQGGLRGQRVILIASPHAGHAAGPSDLRAALEDQGVRVEASVSVADLDVERPQGALWGRAGMRGVVAAGGDGTLSAAVSQIADSGLALGILPLGTMNDVARSLSLPLDLAGAAAVVADGRLARLDIGRARALSGRRHGKESAWWRHGETTYFVQALTLGLHEHFAEHAADSALRASWGPLTAPVAALEALGEARPFGVSLVLREVRGPTVAARLALRLDAIQVTIANMPRIGGPTNIGIARADPDDHLLDIVVLEDLARLGERGAAARSALEQLKDRLLHRQHESDPLIEVGDAMPGIRHLQARSLTLTTARSVPVALDGEPCAATPLEASLAPELVRVLVPRLAGGRADRVAR